MSQRIKVNDQVIVITGQNKGKTGRVVTVDVHKQRVVVSGVNVRKKSVKARTTNGQMEEGGFKSVELPIHLSNVALYDVGNSRREKVSFVKQEDGTRQRCFRSNKQAIVEQKS